MEKKTRNLRNKALLYSNDSNNNDGGYNCGSALGMSPQITSTTLFSESET